MSSQTNGEVPLLPEHTKDAPAKGSRLISRKVAGLLVLSLALFTVAAILLYILPIALGGGDQPLARSRARRTITRPLELSKYRAFFTYIFEDSLPRTEDDFAEGGPCELSAGKVNPCEEQEEPCLECRQDHAFAFFFAHLAHKDLTNYNVTMVEATGTKTMFPDGIIGYLDMRRCDRLFSPFTAARYAEICNDPEKLSECFFECAPHLKPLLELYEERSASPATNGNFKYT